MESGYRRLSQLKIFNETALGNAQRRFSLR